MSQKDKAFAFGLFLVAVFIFAFGYKVGKDDLRDAAIKARAAYWIVDDKGNTTFVWGQKEGSK